MHSITIPGYWAICHETCLVVFGKFYEKLQYSHKTKLEKISQWVIAN